MKGVVFFFSSRRRHTRCGRDWSSDVCSSDLMYGGHIATYWSTNSDEEGLIISSFNAWATMKSATQRFNRYAIKQGKTGMKITPQVYHKKENQRTSNKSFKLM